MFENETQENILQRMIERAGRGASVTEGSLIYSALSLCATALEDAYDKLEEIYQNAFEDTCDREHLIRFARKKGLTPNPATSAQYRANTNIAFAEGTIMTDGENDYIVTDSIQNDENDAIVWLKAQTPGRGGNDFRGEFQPVTHTEGFLFCRFGELEKEGEDEEDTESFRERYFKSLGVKPQYGNRKFYKELTEGVDDVGKAYVTNETYSGGNVRIYITDKNLSPASDELVEKVQNYLDPVSGDGMGVASIYHKIEVAKAPEDKIHFVVHLEKESDISANDLKQQIYKIFEDYLNEINSEFGDGTVRIIRRGELESKVIKIKGVVDFYIDYIGGSAENFRVADEKVVKASGIQYV